MQCFNFRDVSQPFCLFTTSGCSAAEWLHLSRPECTTKVCCPWTIFRTACPPVVTPPPQGYQHGLLDQHQPQYPLQTGQYQMQSGQYYAPVQNVIPLVEGQGLTPSQNQVTSVSQPPPTTPIAHTTPTSVTSTPMSSMSTISQTEVKNEDTKKLDTEITPQKDSKTVTVPPESPLAETLPPDDLNTSNGESVFLKLPKSELEK